MSKSLSQKRGTMKGRAEEMSLLKGKQAQEDVIEAGSGVQKT